ncbi:MAG: porin [Planctomycetota bacterium]
MARMCMVVVAWLAIVPTLTTFADAADDSAVQVAIPRQGPFAIDGGGPKLTIGGHFQARYQSTFGLESDQPEDTVTGFYLPRMRLSFDADLPDDRFSFTVVTDFNRSTGEATALDVYGEAQLNDSTKLRFGQYKLPFTREFDVSSKRVVAVDRSVADGFFRINRTQAVTLDYRGDRVRVRLSSSDGRQASNTTFFDSDEADYAFTGRFELRLGDAGWRQYRDMSSFRGSENGVLLGAAVHFQRDGDTRQPSSLFGDEEVSLLSFTADASFEGDGWNIGTFFYGQTFDGNDNTITDLAFTVQGGLFVTETFEVFARWSQAFPDDDRITNDTFSQVSTGFTRFIIPKSHALKFTFEVAYSPGDQAQSSSLIGRRDFNGIFPDQDNDQFAILAQLQMLF